MINDFNSVDVTVKESLARSLGDQWQIQHLPVLQGGSTNLLLLPTNKVWEGNVFTHVFHSVHRGRGVSV